MIRFSGPATMLTLAVPEIASLVAVTRRLVVAVICAVNRPLLPLIEPPFVVHVGVIGTELLCLSKPFAVNVCISPATTFAGLGDTVIDTSGPASTFTMAVP